MAYTRAPIATDIRIGFGAAKRLLKRLSENMLPDLYGSLFSGEPLNRICSRAAYEIGGMATVDTVITTLTTQYLNKPISANMLLEMYRYLSHNVLELKLGIPTPHHILHETLSETACIRITNISPILVEGRMAIEAEVCWGRLYGKKAAAAFKAPSMDRPLDFCLHIAGINTRSREGHYRDLVGCVLLTNVWSNDGKHLKMSGFVCTDYLKSRNVKLYKERQTKCIHDFPWTCINCPFGTKSCHRATQAENDPIAQAYIDQNNKGIF